MNLSNFKDSLKNKRSKYFVTSGAKGKFTDEHIQWKFNKLLFSMTTNQGFKKFESNFRLKVLFHYYLRQ
jgi:hypothetical protein